MRNKEYERVLKSVQFFENIIAETNHPIYFHAHLARLKAELERLSAIL